MSLTKQAGFLGGAAAIALSGVCVAENTEAGVEEMRSRLLAAYVATKVDSVYEYRAIDFETGETVARWPFPDDSVRWNNWGGITTLLEDGDLLLGGFFSVKRYNIGHLR